ncbi:DUF2177 family protein [Polaromonas eurypsychrophila]|uniref:Membrane protein n=1 Tax=Polaromonas eurypsychrophila TaxID=1614635 RepID=A0A916S6E4_9BURK|nr:DUF2177 family protein [Polaromonas eurypsychrophila]GGA86462.1 membrane protein [Polaromonas eurypsychrophila]
MIKNSLIAYAGTLVFFLAADMLWLGLLMTGSYQAWIGPLMREQPLLLPAALFYLLYPVGLVVFAVRPGLEKQRWINCAALAAFFGLLAYGTYDLSNLATLKGWPWQLTLVDMAWGAALSCGSALAGYAAVQAWGSRPAA